MRDMWRNLKPVTTQLLCYTIFLLFTKNEKNGVSTEEAFLELEPFEHDFNLNLELRI